MRAADSHHREGILRVHCWWSIPHLPRLMVLCLYRSGWGISRKKIPEVPTSASGDLRTGKKEALPKDDDGCTGTMPCLVWSLTLSTTQEVASLWLSRDVGELIRRCNAPPFYQLRGMRFRQVLLHLANTFGQHAICEVTINSRKFAIWTTNNVGVPLSRSSRREIWSGIWPKTACCISRPVSVRHRCQKLALMTAVTANMHTHVFDDTQYRTSTFSNITMPFFASISAMSWA